MKLWEVKQAIDAAYELRGGMAEVIAIMDIPKDVTQPGPGFYPDDVAEFNVMEVVEEDGVVHIRVE